MASRLEEIARIIDPAAWSVGPESYGIPSEEDARWVRTAAWAARAVAQDKARAILALPPPPDTRNAALEEAAAHLRDMGYWTQAAAVLSLRTPKTVAEESVDRWLKDPALKEALHRSPRAETPEAEEFPRTGLEPRGPTKNLRFSRGKDGPEWLGRVSPGYRPCSLCYGMSCAEPNCPECEGDGEVKVFREPTREEARALTDAGYMPVSEYVRLFGDADKA